MNKTLKNYAMKLSALALAFSVVACGTSSGGNAANPERYPDAPSTFEQARCVVNDGIEAFEVAENEGMVLLGTHRKLETAQVGPHGLAVYYNSKTGIADTLTNFGDGKLCYLQTYTDFVVNDENGHEALELNNKPSPETCSFTRYYGKQCGSYEAFISYLDDKKGISKIDFQGVNAAGNIETMLSGNGVSVVITTNKDTGMTVRTGFASKPFYYN